jgi:hypothetical protein
MSGGLQAFLGGFSGRIEEARLKGLCFKERTIEKSSIGNIGFVNAHTRTVSALPFREIEYSRIAY